MSMCKHELEFAYTIDTSYPFGNIISIPILKCSKCKKYFICEDYQRIKSLQEQTNEN